jgi:predicted Zn-dependent peptidase
LSDSAESSSASGVSTSARANGRATKIRQVQLEGSQYANRSPIGDPDILRKAQREQLVRFYRDWYRPS